MDGPISSLSSKSGVTRLELQSLSCSSVSLSRCSFLYPHGTDRQCVETKADIVDLLLNKIRWLDDIGRTSRSNKNEKLENFLSELQRLTIVHETDHDGHGSYRFTNGGGDKEDEEQDKKKEDEKKKDGKGKGKGKGDEKAKGKGGGGAEGDKSMDDQHGAAGEAEGEKQKRDQKEEREERNPKPRDKEGNQAAQGGKAEEK